MPSVTIYYLVIPLLAALLGGVFFTSAERSGHSDMRYMGWASLVVAVCSLCYGFYLSSLDDDDRKRKEREGTERASQQTRKQYDAFIKANDCRKIPVLPGNTHQLFDKQLRPDMRVVGSTQRFYLCSDNVIHAFDFPDSAE